MTAVDRRLGLVTNAAIKVPCRVATTSNITLNGLQAIDGVTVAQDDRVLVKDQTDASENGIYKADSGDWVRSQDFDGVYDVVQGTLVGVTSGTLYALSMWELVTESPVIGTSDLTFSLTAGGLTTIGLLPLSLETLAAAKALTIRPNAIVIKGKTAAFDGWGGVFVWMPGSSTTADDALVFACTAGTAGRYKRLFEGPIHSRWFCAADGSTDDTAGLNAFFSQASAGFPVWIDRSASFYKITAGLDVITGDKIDIDGDGRGAVIKYVNAGATAPTIMTFGDGTSYDRAVVRGFTIESGTTLTGGYGIRYRSYEHLVINVWHGDEESAGWTLYNAAWFDACTLVDLETSRFYATNKGYIWSDGSELNNGTSFIKMAASSGAAQGTGVHIGGGCGGWNGMNLNVLFADIGLLVDTSITGTANREVFTGAAKIDSCKTAAVRLNDALGNSLVFRHNEAAWMASTTAGVGLDVVAWNSGDIFVSGNIKNCSSDGIKLATESPRVTIGDLASIEDNVGYGVNATTAVTVRSNAAPTNNTAGNYHANVTVVRTVDPDRIEAALGGDVDLNNTSNFFTGPSVAQGTAGTWYASGTVTLLDTAGAATFIAKLWDGTTVVDSAVNTSTGANNNVMISLSGYLTSPTGNIRISVRDTSAATGKIKFNASGESKDSKLSAFRIA